MKNKFRNVLAISTVLTLVLIAWGCDSNSKSDSSNDGRAGERAVFAQNMTDPSEKFTAATSGTYNEILVIQIPGSTPSQPENLIKSDRLTQLRNRGFKRVEIKGSDGKLILEKKLD